MYQPRTKILALMIMLTTLACVEETQKPLAPTTHEAEINESEINASEVEGTKDVPHQQPTTLRREKNADAIKSEQECIPEILVGEALATSRNPSEIKFEIRGTQCDSDVLYYSEVIYSGDEETAIGRGWTNVEVLKSEAGHFALAGELWSCGYFGGADHIKVIAHSENGSSTPLLIPINLVDGEDH